MLYPKIRVETDSYRRVLKVFVEGHEIPNVHALDLEYAYGMDDLVEVTFRMVTDAENFDLVCVEE